MLDCGVGSGLSGWVGEVEGWKEMRMLLVFFKRWLVLLLCFVSFDDARSWIPYFMMLLNDQLGLLLCG